MPTYEYACAACKHEWEVSQSIKDNPLKKCPSCKKMKAKRQISMGGGFILKGGGWYSDLYSSPKSGSSSKDGASSTDGGDSSSSASSSSDDAKASTTKSSDSKSSGSSSKGSSSKGSSSKGSGSSAGGSD